jgi:hypothetical protein
LGIKQWQKLGLKRRRHVKMELIKAIVANVCSSIFLPNLTTCAGAPANQLLFKNMLFSQIGGLRCEPHEI